jgi:hypothetical protein
MHRFAGYWVLAFLHTYSRSPIHTLWVFRSKIAARLAWGRTMQFTMQTFAAETGAVQARETQINGSQGFCADLEFFRASNSTWVSSKSKVVTARDKPTLLCSPERLPDILVTQKHHLNVLPLQLHQMINGRKVHSTQRLKHVIE